MGQGHHTLQPLDDWKRMYGCAEDSVQPPSWKFIALWSSLPSYMPVRLGLSTANMPSSSTTFTPVVFADFYGSSGRIKSRTQKSWGKPISRVSTPSCRKPNFGGQGMWCGCWTVTKHYQKFRSLPMNWICGPFGEWKSTKRGWTRKGWKSTMQQEQRCLLA